MCSSAKILRLILLAFISVGGLRAEIAVERSVGDARVTEVIATSSADLVLVDSGYEAGFRQGMVCQVNRVKELLGEVMLVDLRPRSATALILSLNPDRSLQNGDAVVVKTVSTRK